MSKPYFSPTQLEMAGKCMEMYRRRYMEGEKIPPGVAMMKGTAVHAGSKVNMRQKLETHEDLPVKDIVEIAVSEFDKSMAGGFMMTSEEMKRGAQVVVSEAKDATAEMAMFHAKTQAPDYQPLFVEQRILISLPGDRDLLGVLDLADTSDRVVDFKTSGRSKGQAEADGSLQLTTYDASFRKLTGRIPLEVRLDTLVNTERKIQRQVLFSSRNQKDFDSLANRINTLSNAIKAGVFPPTTPSSWWCSERFCGYAKTCPYFSKGQNNEGQ